MFFKGSRNHSLYQVCNDERLAPKVNRCRVVTVESSGNLMFEKEISHKFGCNVFIVYTKPDPDDNSPINSNSNLTIYKY